MISHLHIENIAIVKNVDLYFSHGFNVLTGEAGAGKSVIIGAINVVFGGRVNRDIIRKGCNSLSVSVMLEDIGERKARLIKELGYECEDNSLLIYREFSDKGKNICKINGRPASVSILKQIGKEIIDVYSQHEGYKLMSNDTHIKYIDNFGGLTEEVEEYKNVYDDMLSIKKKLDSVKLDESQIEKRQEFLKYQIDEIEEASVCEGEFERLSNIKNRGNNLQKILLLTNEAKELLNGNESESQGVICGLQRSFEILGQVSSYVKEVVPIAQRLQNVFYETSECLNDLIPIVDSINYDPKEIEDANERLDILYKLSRKYGKSESDMLNVLESSKKELSNLEKREFEIKSLEDEFNKKVCEVTNISNKISLKRKKYADIFSKKVQEELRCLDMPNIKFDARREDVALGPNGCDRIEFFISTNQGEPLKPMSSIASGGELSRIMLAVKNVSSDSDKGTVIFDEVDNGVSGSAANKIGLKLRELSDYKQVICITHLAQIASRANEHFLIKKSNIKGQVEVFVNKLDFNGRKTEISRIISGIELSEATLKAAEEMLNSSHNN